MRSKAAASSQVTAQSQATTLSRSKQTKPVRRSKRLLAHSSGDQQLFLDGLNNDVLAIIVDFLFDMDELNGQWFLVRANPGPYIETHRSTLDLSKVNKKLRSICIPKLFRNIHRCSKTMGQLNRQLKDIEINPSILASVRTCEIVTSSLGDLTLCATRLPFALEIMPFIKELSSRVDHSGTSAMFSITEISLPTVTGLRIQCGGSWHFLIDACPNTDTLILRDDLDNRATMNSVSHLKKLQHLELYQQAWDQASIKMIHEYVPNIQSLALKGGICENRNSFERTSRILYKWTETFAMFFQLQKLAMTIEDSVEEWRYVHSFSDDSVVAESIVRGSKGNGTDIDQRPLAFKYFQECRVLKSLWFWEMATVPYPWTTTRDPKGDVTSVECEYYDDGFDWDTISDQFQTLDQDDFPLVLSFHRHITSYDAKYDPPRLRRTPSPEREEKDARQEEKKWYSKRWMRHADSD